MPSGCFQQLRKDFLISFRTSLFRWKTRMRLAAAAPGAKSLDLNSASHGFRKPIGGSERQRAEISDQWSQALLRTLRTLRREPVPPNVICELQSQGLVTLKALKQELDHLFHTRRFSNLLQLIDNPATVSRDMANYYHGLLEIYGGQVGSHCRNLKTCQLDSLPELMREPHATF